VVETTRYDGTKSAFADCFVGIPARGRIIVEARHPDHRHP